uniref:Uncharacterized protein ycf23 n=1 Tax=Manihot esculenta TaxID=3983 RepID=A0A2C9UH54_MANES
MNSSSISTPISSSSHSLLKPNNNPLLGNFLASKLCYLLKGRVSLTTRALLSATKESVLKGFHERRALKIISGLQNFNRHITHLQVCVSSVDPVAFVAAVEAGALIVEIGNYDSFYEQGGVCSPEQTLNLTKETKRILPSVTLSATPTLAAAYSISRAVDIPVMCSSGLSAVTAPMAITAGASGVGVGSAVNKLNDVVAMIAEIRSIADSLGNPADRHATSEERILTL